jgi:hypothetical protein
LEPGLAKDSCLCPYNQSAEDVGGLDGFLYEAAQNFEVLFKYSRLKLKNSKLKVVDDLFKTYPMVPL